MVQEKVFKQCRSIQLENEFISVIILPEIGGKIASIYRKDKDFELLYQNKEDIYRKPKLYDAFEKFDASGFDDAFPTIDICNVKYGRKEILYPDHGEIWTANFDYKIEGEKVILTHYSDFIKYIYKKTFSLDGDKLVAEYEILNNGDEEFPCIWAMHCLIRCEEDMQLIFPKDTKEVVNVHNSKFLGQVGKIHTYPITCSSKGLPFNLDRVLEASADNMEKYYVKDSVSEGYCGAYYPSRDVKYSVYFDKEKLPYLGFWVTEGGFRGDYNCALEPTNGYYDSIDIAKKEERVCILKSGENLKFNICIELK